MNFIKGMDVSMQKELETKGAEYFYKGEKRDIFEIFKKTGVTAVRLRLWNYPYDEEGNPYGGGTNDLDTTIELAKRIVRSGLDFILDVHYSDFWTDPGKQIKPKAWEGLNGTQLEETVYQYTAGVLVKLKAEGVLPSLVQVGNEITKGFMWPEGHIDNIDEMAGLLNSGISAVKDFDERIGVILHLDFGTDNKLYRDWFSKIEKYDLRYDMIGMSYYPFWNGSMEELKYNMDDISETFGKDVIVAETSYGYTTDHLGCSGMIFSEELAQKTPYPPTKEGQKEFLTDLIKTIRQVKNGRGKGFIYWEPSWLPIPECTWASKAGCEYIKDKAETGNSWGNQALFDETGSANDIFEVLESL